MADWVLWGSLDNLLPLLAESEPNEFLNVVENALRQTPCPFDALFSQEGKGALGRNYLTGLLWALERLAWEDEFLVRVTVILGELSSHDPGGNWSNRPANSLTTIFLPWLPQTMAPIEKRKIAVRTLQKEIPEVGWKLLLSLLPNQHQMSSGSSKPIWRITIPEEPKTVSGKDYWEQVSFYADLAVAMAENNANKLNDIVKHLNHLPKEALEKLLGFFSSSELLSKPESERVNLWISLTEIISRHKRFSNAKWAFNQDMLSKIENIANALAPTDPINLYRRLFNGRDFELYDEKGDWREQSIKLETQRQGAIEHILNYEGIEVVFKLVEIVDAPSSVGNSLGFIATPEIDSTILPDLLENESNKLEQFVAGYIWGRYRNLGWPWVDSIDMTQWSKPNIGEFLKCFPFTDETWDRAKRLLGESEEEYWGKVFVNPYQTESELNFAIDKLIEYGRPRAAIRCLNKVLHDKKVIDNVRAINVLLSAISSRESLQSTDAYEIVEIIKALEDSSDINPDDLFSVEWAYLELLDEFHGASPKFLENRLASEPLFFCELIRFIYRSRKKAKPKKEPTKQEKAVARNAWKLLDQWRTPPGTRHDNSFSTDEFKNWLIRVKKECTESGHLEVALIHIGMVLMYSPPDPDGLWINHVIAEALNASDADAMRRGFSQEIFNSRGVHWIDPTGKPERELAAKYRKQADEVENTGYQRLAVSLRGLADSYEREGERIVREHEAEKKE